MLARRTHQVPVDRARVLVSRLWMSPMNPQKRYPSRELTYHTNVIIINIQVWQTLLAN